jgi:Flp pilus assembly protein TadD
LPLLQKASGEDFQRAAGDLLQIQPPALRNPVKALEFARRAVEVSRGTNASFLIALAQAQRATGDEAGARVTLQKALALLPTRVVEAMLAGK